MINKIVLTIALLLGMQYVNGQTAAERKVGIAVQLLTDAMISGDSAALSNMVMNNLSYGHSGGHIEGKREFIDKIVSGRSDFVSIVLTDQTVTVSGCTALVRHLLTAKTMDNGKPGDVHLRVLLVWQKKRGKWKLLGRQAVKVS